jgi:hypothetical protein
MFHFITDITVATTAMDIIAMVIIARDIIAMEVIAMDITIGGIRGGIGKRAAV